MRPDRNLRYRRKKKRKGIKRKDGKKEREAVLGFGMR